jgi:hypothetical protein
VRYASKLSSSALGLVIDARRLRIAVGRLTGRKLGVLMFARHARQLDQVATAAAGGGVTPYQLDAAFPTDSPFRDQRAAFSQLLAGRIIPRF